MEDLSTNEPRSRAEALVHRMLDYDLTDAEHAELLECLRQDPAARELFLEQSRLHAALRERGQAGVNDSLCSHLFGVRQDELSELAPLTAQLLDQKSAAAIPAPCDPCGADGLTDFGEGNAPGLWGKPGMFGVFFTSLITVGVVWLWLSGFVMRQPVPRDAQGTAKANSESTTPEPEYVARIVKASDGCVWGNQSRPAEFLLRVRAGDRMQLMVGLVEMEFHCGARVILHGPTVFTPTGPASGHLESGRLTGEVANGDFRLMTPAAEVIDLGTAFGVVADAEAGTDVVVFDGKVQVVSQTDPRESKETVNMTEGMAARFRFDGTTEYGLKTDANKFARKVSPSAESDDPSEICLIDVIAGGNGLSAHLAGAIDPLTGQRDYGEEGRKSKHYGRWTDGAFHAAPWHPLIDGVFVPFPTGQKIQIDSRGDVLDLPSTTGTTHGSIWARRKESISESDRGPDNDFWGTRTLKGIVRKLKQTQIGLIGMHSNVGITLDLRALQMAHRRAPLEFHAAVANIENSDDWAPIERPVPEVATRIADCRVLVDGKLQASRLGFRREDGDLELVVPLALGSRFLTILVTDGDGEMRFDHVVLIDPVISLATE
jgi:hypothetical protein